ncbi:MAG: (2Fe-2S) ferredoxin domain-containing protein [Methanosarcinaceae archaeon]|nr:(2Fe-2S) ferredoxin domain-containing protein [Methanosarcinaceae archaeon]
MSKAKLAMEICMGSACHQKGVNKVLPIIQRLIGACELDRVELKGSFCLGPCVDGIVIQFAGKQFLKISPENIEDKFLNEILPFIRKVIDEYRE